MAFLSAADGERLEALLPIERTLFAFAAFYGRGLQYSDLHTFCRRLLGVEHLPDEQTWLRACVRAELGELGARAPNLWSIHWTPQARNLACAWLLDTGLARRLAAELHVGTVQRLRARSYQLAPELDLLTSVAVLGGANLAQVRTALQQFDAGSADVLVSRALDRCAPTPVSLTGLDHLDPSIQLLIVMPLLSEAQHIVHPDATRWYERALALCAQLKISSARLPRDLLPSALLLQDAAVLEGLHAGAPFAQVPGVMAAGLMPSAAQARVLLDAALNSDGATQSRAAARRPLPSILGLWHALALAAEPDKAGLALLARFVKAARTQPEQAEAEALGWIEDVARCLHEARSWVPPWQKLDRDPTTLLLRVPPPLDCGVLAVLLRWTGHAWPAELLDRLRAYAGEMRALGWLWLADVLDASLGEPVAAPALIGWRRVEQPWERVVRAVQAYAGGDETTQKLASVIGRHALLRVGLIREVPLRIEIRELKPLDKGGYSQGRLLEPRKSVAETLARLDPADEQSRRLLQQWQRDTALMADPVQAPWFDALVGFPRLYARDSWNGEEREVRLQRIEPQLRMTREADGSVNLAVDPPARADGVCKQLLWGEKELTLVEFDAATLNLSRALGPGAKVPAEALPGLLALVPQLSRRIALRTELGEAQRVTDLDPRIHVLLETQREGLRLRLRTRPLGADGVYVVPAAGAPELMGLRAQQAVSGLRDFAAEQRALDALLQAVPLLAGGEQGEAVDLTDPETALDVLAQLQDLGEQVVLAWPAGRPWKLSATVRANQLDLRVQAQRDWFAAEGGLEIDQGEVISLATLLTALPSSQGRFIRLEGERIVALSQELARQLRQLRTLADERGRVRLAAAAAGMLQPLQDAGAKVDLDAGFRAQIERIAAAAEVQAELPKLLQAELRDYQIEGYRWLMRLASWGAGACLADDMGLGKTLQTLAVLLARAEAGPALVVAPTSVVPNWRMEARRFAPTLELRQFGEGDRSQTLEQLGPGQVVLVSYGLLTLNIERFAGIPFATLVLDEAQAIKNAAAQRSQAITQLQAAFRIATTGTPIENHLGELWSLMRVLNPGLLGSQEHFNRRFVGPIERDPRASERDSLRRLISPFILRRLKSQVLNELPPRTEIVLNIEPSAAEAQLLAAIRRQAIERIGIAGQTIENQRFNILAALTRLRRAACHPALVAPELNLPGAKLEALLRLVRELKENRHRALVFSQFTDFLALIRPAFEAAGIGYQYLDGSTPSAAREAAVRAFQAGQGEVFLLSLKAGGVGLNLTAADYVIHLDPWWNPAVEQQATDRAHRFGQTRPVTVYKLVVNGSIESQILAMHGSKRDLADSMLSDQDGGTRLGLDELLALLAGESD